MSPNTATTTKDDTNKDVPVHAVAMKLLDVRLQPSTALLTVLRGDFVGKHEVACVGVSHIEIRKLTAGLPVVRRIRTTHSTHRSAVVVRVTGASHDVLCVTSDSGALSVLEFHETDTYKILHTAQFGKTGCRRATPGQYIAADPAGRAVLVAAVEKRKLVWVLNRDATGTPTLASPLEAHRARTLTYAAVGLDNGYDNPIFAVLELQYPEEEDDDTNTTENSSTVLKQVAYYELDLGLNHVSRRWATTVQRTACCLAALPGGADGPGGVLVGGEDWITYCHESSKTRIACPIPRRERHPATKGILVTQLVVHRQKKSNFFALAQTELGDVYKITVQVSSDNTVVEGLQIAVLDTLPTANALAISKQGLLFCAAEFGNHFLYQFQRIDVPAVCDSTRVPADCALTPATATQYGVTFVPDHLLQNLSRVQALDNPSPTTDIMVGELAGNEVSPQIYTLTGRGPTAALRIVRHGASVTELAVSDLPGVPGGIFTVAGDDKNDDKYIVVSFADATLVLSIGASVEEVGKESGFLTNAPTLACTALTGGAMCQVHPSGVRQIQAGQAKQWDCPGLKRIECASANESQVIVALAGGQVIYFELDPMSGNLTEKTTKDMGADVCALSVGTLETGKSRSLFAAIGCRDQTVRIVSLDPNGLLAQKSSTALKSRPHSVALQTIVGVDSDGTPTGQDDLTLMMGLDDGSSLRASVDPVTGSIGTSPTRRFLGARPVAVSRIRLNAQNATLLLSSRPWITRRVSGGKYVTAPLSYVPLDYGCSFSSGDIEEGIVATAGKTLRILSLDSSAVDDEAFNTNTAELRYTPRQMALLSVTEGENQRKVVLAVVESDCNDYGLEEKNALGFAATGGGSGGVAKGDAKDSSMDMDVDSDDEDGAKKGEEEGDGDEDDEEKEAQKTPVRGPVPPGPGHWGSCVRIVDPSNGCAVLDCIEMGRNEAALCCASVRFHSKGGEPLLAVGTVTGMTTNPLKQSASHIILYRLVTGGRLQLLHRTTIDDGPVLALAHFQGRLLAGIGKSVRLYEMGKRQLLRKCERRGLPTFVKRIQTVGDRAFIGDMMQSIRVLRYDANANKLALIAIDPNPRAVVSQELLDWNTVAVGDKFGNISILRMPRGADTSAVDLTGQRALWDSAREDFTPKMELLCQYYVGEIVTAMTRSSLVAGGTESLIYTTVSGRLGAMVPFVSRSDVEFFSQLEGLLRKEAPRPTGRDPQSYRGFYAPALHVVDGDLCDSFLSLSYEKQSKIAEEMERTPAEIMKKLEDTRNALL